MYLLVKSHSLFLARPSRGEGNKPNGSSAEQLSLFRRLTSSGSTLLSLPTRLAVWFSYSVLTWLASGASDMFQLLTLKEGEGDALQDQDGHCQYSRRA